MASSYYIYTRKYLANMLALQYVSNLYPHIQFIGLFGFRMHILSEYLTGKLTRLTGTVKFKFTDLTLWIYVPYSFI